MTKKDYIKIAEALNEVKPTGKKEKVVWNNIVNAISLACKRDNYAFKPDRFQTACEGAK